MQQLQLLLSKKVVESMDQAVVSEKSVLRRINGADADN